MMKKPYTYLAVFIVISVFTFLIYYFINSNEDNNKFIDQHPFTLQVLEKDSSWIYEIYNEDNLFIRQEFIPSVKGKQIFKSKEDAEKIGKLVVSKLSKNAFPVISETDLKENNISFEHTN
ncbi:DUF4907 domain-containing protein [Winogradskyella eckloniae]|uniref:DUF4907 domain-containing protein n=1 Tax=Winogradskyella eckloniae TaxID=1089306 RepID=UPI0015679866|nr:DUF4907 domain-containing protein [Winogradskyella eckloniae]NRD20124.1 DUF4907 domain-containing protein [Winogradskyella eckloniae]